MNRADGEIRFRTSVASSGADITPGIIGHLIHSNLFIVDERIFQIMSMLYSDLSPEAALKPKGQTTRVTLEPQFDLN